MNEEEEKINESLFTKNFNYKLKEKNFLLSIKVLDNENKNEKKINENEEDILSFYIEVENTFPKVIYEKNFMFKEVQKYYRWFRLFDNFRDSFDSVVNLIDNNNYSLIEETNSVQFFLNHLDKNIKDSIFLIPQKELNKDEIIKDLILSHNELRTKVFELEQKLLNYINKEKILRNIKMIYTIQDYSVMINIYTI